MYGCDYILEKWKTYLQKMWKNKLFTNLSTFNVDKFVKKCAEMRKNH
jgi:hypothetical protein